MYSLGLDIVAAGTEVAGVRHDEKVCRVSTLKDPFDLTALLSSERAAPHLTSSH